MKKIDVKFVLKGLAYVGLIIMIIIMTELMEILLNQACMLSVNTLMWYPPFFVL